ncbi:multicopper oxidase-domain-containing protein [Aspergillus ambiguus]|uniref:multicopper oxidase-domain-containing protein n=1 Tax=Aspergillus ambiguus TaxID=176160 RepID=UPI003CCD97B3
MLKARLNLTKLLWALGLCGLPVASSSATISDNCTHGAHIRACWGNGFNIFTDYSNPSNVPPGKLVEYDLVVSHQSIAPDGYERPGLVVNGQYPGPTIEANWGDTLRITVHNNLTWNGTSIHWHGLHQWHANWVDGVPGVTQCPIPPGQSQVYEFRAMQYGTTWYHSHYAEASHSTNERIGPLVIHGPSSANYDSALGPWLLGDYFHTDIFGAQETDGVAKDDPLVVTSTINGKGVSNRTIDHGEHFEVIFQTGWKYKIGLVGTQSAVAHIFWIDGHNFTVIQADLVPIEPYITDTLVVALGQRYEIVVEANADISHDTDFWIHLKSCDETKPVPHRVGIVRYDAGSTNLPNTYPLSIHRQHPICKDPDPTSLVPVVRQKVGNRVNTRDPVDYLTVGRQTYTTPDLESRFFKWIMKDRPQLLNLAEPSLKSVSENSQVQLRPETVPVYLDFDTDEWVQFVITTNYSLSIVDTPRVEFPSYHPIHLHGHDFAILAQGHGPFTEDIVPNLDNPPRRDTAVVEAGGYLWIAFQLNNPGVWLLHCHYLHHSESGLSLQFIEQRSKIKELMDEGGKFDELSNQCDVWSRWSRESTDLDDTM